MNGWSKERNMQPKVSVVIPVYNAQEFLKESLDSVTSQTLEEIEIICVDDGSTDDSLNILKEYAQKDARFQILTQTNLFAGVARNAGLEVATGEYVYFFDCDDILHKDALKLLYQSAIALDSDIVKGKAQTFDHDTGACVVSPRYQLESIPKTCFGRNLSFSTDYKILLYCSVAPWTALFKRFFLVENQIKFPSFRCVNDRLFFNETLCTARSVQITDIEIQNHRVNNQNSLIGQRMDHFDCQFKSYNLILEKLNHLPKDHLKAILNEELSDIMLWYSALKDTFETNDIKKQLIHFVKNLDLSPWEDDFEHTKWYKQYLKIKPNYYPAISVIIPVYNVERYLEKCLDTLVNQSFKSFEIICIDDGSSDDSLEILKKYSDKYDCIYFSAQNHLGAGEARNYGMSMAQGEYFLYLDSDDFFDLSMLEKCYNKISETSADMCVFGAQNYNEGVDTITPMPWMLNELFLPQKDTFSLVELEPNGFDITAPVPWNKLIRAKLALKNNVRFQSIQYSNDVAFILTCMALADKITILKEVLVTYRRFHIESLQTNRSKNALLFLESLRELKKRLVYYGKYEKLRVSYANRVMNSLAHNIEAIEDINNARAIYDLINSDQWEEFSLDLLHKKNCGKKENYNNISQLKTESFEWNLANNKLLKKSCKLREEKQRACGSSILKNEKQIVTRENVQRLNKKCDQLTARILELENSRSYKIGRFITFVPRKIRSSVKCYQEHGMKFTLLRIKHAMKF